MSAYLLEDCKRSCISSTEPRFLNFFSMQSAALLHRENAEVCIYGKN